MENEVSEKQLFKLEFNGEGKTYFGILLINWLLSAITLSLYYPWAKAKKLNYLYSSTFFDGDNFSFHGTGREMFIGYIKTLLIFVLIFGFFLLMMFLDMPIIGAIVFYFALIALIPLAIHGSYRYRLSRTTWRGIQFGYRGNRSEFVFNFFKWIFYSIITLGIYTSWMDINMRKYVLGNIRCGDIEFKYKGNGADYFILNLVGTILSLLTLGIYFFWFYKKLFSYYVDNLSLTKDAKEIKFKASLTAGDIFKVGFVNLLILLFTLGLGYAWVATRTLKLVLSKIELSGDIDLNSIQQTEEDYNDATGEDMSSFLNIDLVI